MAFIRQYAETGDPGSLRQYMSGDPGFGKWLRKRFKPPKVLRKMKMGGLLKKAAGFIPGVGGFAALLPEPRAERPMEQPPIFVPEEEEEPEVPDYVRDFLSRYFGIDVGDPGKPPRAARKRKRAASGTRAKAAHKRQVRGARGKRGLDIGGSLAAGGRAVAGALPGLIEALKAGGPAAGMQFMAASGVEPKVLKMPRLGARRRAMNPANVKALRRGLRRVEGFEKLVARVHKAYPRLTRSARTVRTGGHRPGCRCVACRPGRRAA